jgi:hypothetical protein
MFGVFCTYASTNGQLMTAAAPITINADEVNCLIYAYLKDSGNSFISFTFLPPRLSTYCLLST